MVHSKCTENSLSAKIHVFIVVHGPCHIALNINLERKCNISFRLGC